MLLKKILKNINLLNIVLVVMAVLFAGYWLSPMLAAKMKYALPAVKKPVVANGEEEASQPQQPSVTEYTLISEENLFHPERRIPPEKKADEAPLPKPDFVLYGTLIADNIELAYLEDLKAPRSTPGRGKRQVAMKKGDTMSGYTVKEIDTDKVVMARGEEKVIVPMNDPSHPKTRDGETTTTQETQSAPANAHRNVHGNVPSVSRHRPAARTASPAREQHPVSSQAPSSQTARRVRGVIGSDIKTTPIPRPGGISGPNGGGGLLFGK
jgi:FtsZ-interacting cell division protein ZipA